MRTSRANLLHLAIIGTALTLAACGTKSEESAPKFDEVVTKYDATKYEFALSVLESCLVDMTAPNCIANVRPSIILPIRLASRAEEQKVKDGFEATPSVFRCDPGATNACEVEIDRVNPSAGDLEVLTDSREQLTKLTFTGSTLKIKMRLETHRDHSKTVELCKVSGVMATKKVLFSSLDANVIHATFDYDSNGKLVDDKPIIVTVDTLGGNTTDNCDF